MEGRRKAEASLKLKGKQTARTDPGTLHTWESSSRRKKDVHTHIHNERTQTYVPLFANLFTYTTNFNKRGKKE